MTFETLKAYLDGYVNNDLSVTLLTSSGPVTLRGIRKIAQYTSKDNRVQIDAASIEIAGRSVKEGHPELMIYPEAVLGVVRQ